MDRLAKALEKRGCHAKVAQTVLSMCVRPKRGGHRLPTLRSNLRLPDPQRSRVFDVWCGRNARPHPRPSPAWERESLRPRDP